MTDVSELLRRELERLQPSQGGLDRTMRRARARHRTRRLAATGLGLGLTGLLVVAGWSLAKRPEPNPPVGPTGSVSASATAAATTCTQAATNGDFDGDGTLDQAEFVEIAPGRVSCDRAGDVFENLSAQEIRVRFGSGAELDAPFADCQGGLCAAVFEATDLDGDGRDELAIDVSGCGATCLVELYRVDPGGIRALVIAYPGDPPYVRPGPAILGGGFDSALQSPVVCEVNDDGTRELVSIHAENVGGSLGGPWEVHTTNMVLEEGRLVVTSTNDLTETFRETSEIPSFAKGPFENACAAIAG